MSEVVIRVENLSKRYRIGGAQGHYTYGSLRDSVSNAALAPVRRLRHLARGTKPPEPEHIWALDDVTFEVHKGEALGIIGRNGAGKSTLLKILSRITKPTKGRVTLRGRVGSLLEVGTGFHPELSGRENIYLNGAILGMKRVEIECKFDEIVDFAEIEKFLDTPVKFYSSGMYMRLAFAVAAHLEPEILLVDEVLAVGDAAFQKKCLGRMGEVAKGGRTVLFVSHNMASITRLCETALLLDHGELILMGESQNVTRFYLTHDRYNTAEHIWSFDEAPGNEVARLHAVRILDGNGEIAGTLDITQPIYIEIQYWNFQQKLKPTSIIHIVNETGITLLASNDWNNQEWWNTPRQPGLVTAVCMVPGNFLAEGSYYILAAIGTYNPNVIHAIEKDVVTFQVIDRTANEGVRGKYAGSHWPGVVRPMLSWKVECDEDHSIFQAK